MKKYFYIFIFLFLLVVPNVSFGAVSLANRLAGRIVLQTQGHGEAWYIDPTNLTRYYLGRPEEMLQVMRERGIGISNQNLEKIPADGSVSGTALIDKKLVEKSKGKIFLQVESRGEAWYVNPADGKRYFLGDSVSALKLVRSFGLGISDQNLAQISASPYDGESSSMERLIFGLINEERVNNGLKPLSWNKEVAGTARRHSQDLAKENESLTGLGMSCEFPFIHHEGLTFGLYQNNRLNNQGLYYFSKSAENIILASQADVTAVFSSGDEREAIANQCYAKQAVIGGMSSLIGNSAHTFTPEQIKLEIKKRQIALSEEKMMNQAEAEWLPEREVAEEIIARWLASPEHERNILDPSFDQTGIGTAPVNGYLIATQVFIKRIDCGYKDGACCVKSGYKPYCATGLSCNNNVCR